MTIVKWGFIGLVLLPVAEIAAFIVVASVFGWLSAAGLFVATTLAGLLLLRRSGAGDIERFRNAFRQDGLQAIHLESPGLGPMLGAILLVFPGFITDILGTLLLIPAVRRQLRKQIAHSREIRRRQNEPNVVDLTPRDWRQISELPTRNERPRQPTRP